MRTYEEQICQAVDVIAQEKINSANFDRTIEARILSCEDSLTGKYRIKYQNSTFIAYSGDANITYEEGTFVYVLIPGNDPEKDKLILWAGADYSGREIEQNAYSGWYGSGVGRFTNPEKNSELFNDYKNSKVDIKAQYCHIEGEKHTISQSNGGSISHTHIGGYQNRVSSTNGTIFSSIIHSYNSECDGANYSLVMGGQHKITKCDGVEVFGIGNNVKKIYNSLIMGQNISIEGHPNSSNSYNVFLGYGSNVTNQKKSFNYNIVGGYLNLISSIQTIGTIVYGCQNSLLSSGVSAYSAILGGYNQIYSSEADLVIGYKNGRDAGKTSAYLSGGNFIGGVQNFAGIMQRSYLSGHANKVTGGCLDSIITGLGNKIIGGERNIIGGLSNSIIGGCIDNFVNGMWNSLNMKRSFVIGASNRGILSIPNLFYGDTITKEEYANYINQNSEFSNLFTNNDNNGYIYTSVEPNYYFYISPQSPGPFPPNTTEAPTPINHIIEDCIIAGAANQFLDNSTSYRSMILGQGNHIYPPPKGSYSIVNSIISGYNNHIYNVTHSLIIGQQNQIYSNSGNSLTKSIVFGFDNKINENFGYPILLGGQKNKIDNSKCYLMILGNGGQLPGDAEGTMRYGERSNAFAVDIDGNVYCKSIRKMPLSGGDTPGVDLSIYYTKEESDKIFGNISCGINFPIIAEKTLGDIFFLEEEVSNIDSSTSEEIIENVYKDAYICTPKGWEKLFYDDTNKITYKGIVEKFENLPSEENKIGDLYLVKKYKSSSKEDNLEFLCYMEYLFTENGWEPIFYQEEEDTRVLLQLKGFLKDEKELIALTDNQEGDSYFILEKTEAEIEIETEKNNISIAYQYIYFNSQWIKIGGKYVETAIFNKTIEELNSSINNINSSITTIQTNITENKEAITNINSALLKMQQDLNNNNNNINTINETLDNLDTRITQLEDNPTPEQEDIYLTNIDFNETGFILTNNLSQTQSCTIEENIEENKNIITITNITTGRVLTITQPISSSNDVSE